MQKSTSRCALKRLRLSFALIGLGLAATGCDRAGGGDADAVEAAPRRVVLISIDALRPDFLGAYDASRSGTPGLDALAAAGVVFEDVLAQGASTAISHKSILYSLYPAIHQTTISAVPTESVVSPVEALRRAGMRTAAFVDGGQLDPRYGIDAGFELYDSHGGGDRPLADLGTVAEGWLEEHAAESFFLFLHTYQVHAPYDPPEEFRQRFAGWYEGDLDPSGKSGVDFYNDVKLSDEEVRFLRSLYEAEVAYADRFVGGVLAALERLGIAAETWVVLLSDHGESLGEEFYVGHNQLKPVQLKIPLIVRGPGLRPGRVTEPVESIDLLPTLFSVLGVEPPYRFQGRDLLPALSRSEALPTDRIRLAQQGERVYAESAEWRWHFHLAGKQRERLYRKSADGRLTEWDLSISWPDEGRRLKQAYYDSVQEAADLAAEFVVGAQSDPTEDAEVRRQLEALGYLQ